MKATIDLHGCLSTVGTPKFCPFAAGSDSRCGTWCPLFCIYPRPDHDGQYLVDLRCARQSTTYVIEDDNGTE